MHAGVHQTTHRGTWNLSFQVPGQTGWAPFINVRTLHGACKSKAQVMAALEDLDTGGTIRSQDVDGHTAAAMCCKTRCVVQGRGEEGFPEEDEEDVAP